MCPSSHLLVPLAATLPSLRLTSLDAIQSTLPTTTVMVVMELELHNLWQSNVHLALGDFRYMVPLQIEACFIDTFYSCLCRWMYLPQPPHQLGPVTST